MTELALPDTASALFSTAQDPVLIWCDDATGERVALTAAQLRGWIARTANLLIDGCGLAPGARAALLLRPHWQSAAVLFGAWTAGVAVSIRPAATAGLRALGPGQDEPFDAVFAAADRIGRWLDEVPAAHHRFVIGGSADGFRDFLTEVQRYGEDPAPSSRGAAATVDGTSYDEWTKIARIMAERAGITAGERVLVDGTEHDDPLTWLLAPLAGGASVVVCVNLDRSRLDQRIADEQVTRVYPAA